VGVAETKAVMEAYTGGGGSLFDVIDESAVYHDVGSGDDRVGHEQIAAMFKEFYQERLVGEATLVSSVVGEDAFSCEYRMTGRHVGEFAGKPGTGEEFTADFAVFYQVTDGKIMAARVYFPSEQVVGA